MFAIVAMLMMFVLLVVALIIVIMRTRPAPDGIHQQDDPDALDTQAGRAEAMRAFAQQQAEQLARECKEGNFD